MKDLLKQYAANYAQRGWVCIPVADKRPVVTDWRRIPVAESSTDIEQRFDVKCNGIGIVAGRPSGNLLIVDIDDKQLIPQFESVVGDLAHTMKVTTNHGAHFYYVIGDPLLARSDIHFNFPAIQLIYNTQVVAPPTPGYQLVLDIEPRVISASEYSQIYEFAKSPGDPGSPGAAAPARPPVKVPAQKPVAATAHPPATADLIGMFHAHLATHTSRNETLFRLALHARDNGIRADEYAEAVALEFILAQPTGKHRKQTQMQRRNELVATIKSAYSRPARQPGQRKGRLWDSTRERCAQTGNMALWRVLDGLYAVFTLNQVFTRQEAIQALRGQVGWKSVVAALESFGGQLFQKKALPPLPPPKTTELPEADTESGDNECYAVGAKNRKKQKSGTNNPYGRSTFAYILPPVKRVASVLGVPKIHKHSTPMKHLSSKEARKALYKSKIERKPGKYANVALATWLGVCKQTVKNYEKELKIRRQPQYDECPVHTWNVDKLPWLDEPQMGLWLQSGSKRYPALESIALKLLRFGRRVYLMRQLPNYISLHGNLQQLALPLSDEPPAPRASVQHRSPRSDSGSTLDKPNLRQRTVQRQPVPKPAKQPQRQILPKHPALDALKRDWRGYEPRHLGDLEGRYHLAQEAWREAIGCDLSKSTNPILQFNQRFQWRWLRQKSPRALLNWIAKEKSRKTPAPSASKTAPQRESVETLAIREVQRLTALQDGKKTIASKTAETLIAQYGVATVLEAARQCEQRSTVRNRAGLLISMLQSNAKAREFRQKWGSPV